MALILPFRWKGWTKVGFWFAFGLLWVCFWLDLEWLSFCLSVGKVGFRLDLGWLLVGFRLALGLP